MTDTVHLTPMQRLVLHALVHADGRILSCEQIASAVYDHRGKFPPTDFKNTLRVTIHDLRQKLEHAPYRIDTAHTRGYRLRRRQNLPNAA